MNDAFDRQVTSNIYYRIIRPDGTLRYLHAMAKPITDKNGLPKVIGVSRDITERRTAELGLEAKTRELEQALLELQKSDEAKNYFLATLSHELRNPLAPILSAVELLQLRNELTPENQQSIEVIDRQVQNLKALLGDLLDLSRIEQGKIQLRKSDIDIREIITRAAETAAPTIKARRHHLTVTLPTDPIMFFGDELRLEQSLVNLLYNASKFSDPGSSITLTCVENEKHTLISVKDEGIGIEENLLKVIFEPFSDFERSASALRGGLGIGLKLVKVLVGLHGGTVEAKSEGLGRGSEFIISLPKGTRPASKENTLAQQERIATPEMEETENKNAQWKILVVDDNQNAATAMSALLKALGYDAQHAFSGMGTLTMIERFSPHFFLLDIGMPGMDGYELAKRLRNVYKQEDAVLIAVSGYGQYEDQERARIAGFNEHLTKPVSSRELQHILQKYTKTNMGNAELF
jgi:signal transduction histidine kinase/ActR/RegA family two-component response regulator